MNAATARRIEEMKKQTIGVEVEMYGITREKAAKIAAGFFARDAQGTPPPATAIAPGAPGTGRDANGNSSGTSASTPTAASRRSS